jgi:hypothetical protein
VIDLSGEVTTAHPHSLALVTAAARVVEAELGRRVEREHERLRAIWQARLSRRRLATAVLSWAGTVVLTTPDRWIDGLIDVPEGGGAVSLPEGGEAISEPLPRGEGFLVWRAGSPAPGASPTSSLKRLSVRALGRARAGLLVAPSCLGFGGFWASTCLVAETVFTGRWTPTSSRWVSS